jgi:hypothetical protein
MEKRNSLLMFFRVLFNNTICSITSNPRFVSTLLLVLNCLVTISRLGTILFYEDYGEHPAWMFIHLLIVLYHSFAFHCYFLTRMENKSNFLRSYWHNRVVRSFYLMIGQCMLNLEMIGYSQEHLFIILLLVSAFESRYSTSGLWYYQFMITFPAVISIIRRCYFHLL